MKDKIEVAYSSSKNVYDDVMTQGTLLTRLYNRIFWDGVDDRTIAKKVLKYIPDEFSGDLLDVPVGTAYLPLRSINVFRRPVFSPWTTVKTC